MLDHRVIVECVVDPTWMLESDALVVQRGPEKRFPRLKGYRFQHKSCYAFKHHDDAAIRAVGDLMSTYQLVACWAHELSISEL